MSQGKGCHEVYILKAVFNICLYFTTQYTTVTIQIPINWQYGGYTCLVCSSLLTSSSQWVLGNVGASSAKHPKNVKRGPPASLEKQ
jgi:hypothetical protein